MNKTKKINYEAIVFIAILILGAFFRIYRLGALPGGLQRDESTVAMNAFNLFHNGTDFVGNVNPFYMTDWGDGHTNMYVWLTQIPLFFNRGVLTPLVSRIPQAIVSILSLAAVYGIGKNTFGSKFGLWAMFFLAVCPWHISMSRWGLDANLAPGFMMISLYFFVKGLKKEYNYIIAAVFYGLTLYTYAITWPIVPITLLLMFIYLLCFKKIKITRYTVIAIIVLLVIAVPPILFVLINNGYLSDIHLPFFSIVSMNKYRGQEVSTNVGTSIIENLKQTYHLFVYQKDAGEIWEIRLPWGIFYDLGRFFIAVGGVWIIVSSICSFIKKQFAWEVIIAINVLSASISCLLSYPHLHRINVLYIPMILCGAYAIFKIAELLYKKKKAISIVFQSLVGVGFALYLTLFWSDYTSDYNTLTEAYWGVGMDECVETALNACEEKNLKMITVEKAAQWPKLIIYTETLAPEFTENVVYEQYPIPWSFTTGDITVQTRIDYDTITQESVYIIYFTDYDIFKDDFDMIKIYDWYVAIPK